MTRPLDRHLDSDELEALVSSQTPGVPVARRLSEEALPEIQRHVEFCQDCHRKVQMHRSAQNAISMRAQSGPAPKDPDCSNEDEWLKVASGLFQETEAKERMNHASQCGHCGPLLKAAIRNLSDETTPDEENALAKLTSARPDWQAQMARTLRTIGEVRRSQEFVLSFWKDLFHWPRSAFAVAASIVLLATIWIGLRMVRPPTAEQLLAQAYTERRTLEVRIPGARYAPLRVERSARSSSIDKPASLLRAEALIGENLRKHPNDPTWLNAEARADLLEGNFESAIVSLRQALEMQPDSPPLLIDLGSAYFERAESTDRPIDYGNAIEALGKALEKSPDNSVALFNRALACERAFLYTQAVDDWEHYLRVDPKGEWAEQARIRLTAVKEKLKQHAQRASEPLLSPEDIAKAGADENANRRKIDERVEEYLAIAVSDWLPAVGISSKQNEGKTALVRDALYVIARISKENHGDDWLSDMLGDRSDQFGTAVATLAEAVRNDDSGKYDEAAVSALKSEILFSKSGNLAGTLRSRAENVYALHLAHKGTACLRALASVEPLAERRSYRWLQVQMYIEHAVCAGMMGNLGVATRLLEVAREKAKTSHYPTIYLRATGIESDLNSLAGDNVLGWSLAFSGLSGYWSRGIRTSMVGYNFYTDLDSAADIDDQPHLQLAIWKQALVLVDTERDPVLRAMAHFWTAKAAFEANVPAYARQEFAASTQLFSECPHSEATSNDRLEAETWLALSESRLGYNEQALERLKRVEPDVKSLSNKYVAIHFFSALGGLQLQSGFLTDADQSLRTAVSLAELHLRSLKTSKEAELWSRETAGAYRSLTALEIKQGDPKMALEVWEWFKGAGTRSAPAFGSSPGEAPDGETTLQAASSLKVVTDRLPSLTDRTVVSYAVLADGFQIWVFDDRGIQAKWIPGPIDRIEALARRFYALCATPTSPKQQIELTSRELYDLTIAPIEEMLEPHRKLVVELDASIAEIPVEALLDQSFHFLAEREQVVYSPGLYYHRVSDPGGITAETPALVVAIPSSSTDNAHLPILEDAVTEAESVADKFRTVDFLRGTNATLNELRHRLRSVSVFHFAGHANYSVTGTALLLANSPAQPDESSTVDASSLDPASLRHLRLAVLSGCATGRETGISRGAPENISGAFLRSGVPNTVASRWDVESNVTLNFMKIFYGHLLEGNAVSDSVHTAELSLLSSSETSHPYYWSSFALFQLQ